MRRPWKPLPWILILIATTHGLPYTDYSDRYDFPQIYQESGQQADQGPLIGDYGEFVDANGQDFIETGFTVSCLGHNRICLDKNLCPTGFISSLVVAQLNSNSDNCRINDEVCCTIQEEYQPSVGQETIHEEEEKDVYLDTNQSSDNSVFQPVEQTTEHRTVPEQTFETGGAAGSTPLEASENTAFLAVATHIQLGCAAALICVEERFCTLDGTISPEPVALTNKQLLRRVPLSNCKNPDNGVIGKCCRDPNYVDPWPTENLPANYSGGFDEQGFPTFLNIAKVRAPKKPTAPPTKQAPKPTPPPVFERKPEGSSQVPKVIEGSTSSPQFVQPPNQVATMVNKLENPGYEINPEIKQEPNTASPVALLPQCGVKNNVVRGPGSEESQTLFGEIPWQAMVLHSEERKILCSGALINSNSVLTAGNCVDHLAPNDVSIKLGEWKLGYELKHEEPLPFEILNVAKIRMHPEYRKGSPSHDLALLMLDRPASFNYHINPLCLPETENVAQASGHCITTGWGKVILQGHYAGSIMHSLPVDVLSKETCDSRLSQTEYGVNFYENGICTKTKQQRNNMCQGDIGGPLACDNGKGAYELAGIYSQDTGCLPTNQVAVFAPIDMTWIKGELPQPKTEIEAPVEEPEPSPSEDVNYRKSTLQTDNQYLPPY